MSKVIKKELPQGFQQKTIGIRGFIKDDEESNDNIYYYLDSMGSGNLYSRILLFIINFKNRRNSPAL